jgi:putative methyltransferase (TIGR04325 family)
MSNLEKSLRTEIFSVWEGVYQSFDEAGGDADVFDSEIWIHKQQNKVYKELQTQKSISNAVASKDYPLAVLLAIELSYKNVLSVLDFGGGMGLQYLELYNKLPNFCSTVDYHVVDRKIIIENIPQELNKFSNLHFFSDLNKITTKVNIIHIGSTLQYTENWQSILQILKNKFEPEYFVFSDLFVGEIPSFVSHQVYYDKKIPVKFINLTEFIETMELLGYRFIYKTLYQVPILGHDVLPNAALPQEYRLKHSMNMIFKLGC